MLSYSKPLESNYSASGTISAPGAINPIEAKDPDVDGWTAQGDLIFGSWGVLAGYSKREFGSNIDSKEYIGGFRYWLGGSKAGYLIALGRYSEGLEIPAGDSHSYWGYGVGAGTLTQMTENIFLDARLLYEQLFDDIGVGPTDVDLHGLVISLGIAIGQ